MWMRGTKDGSLQIIIFSFSQNVKIKIWHFFSISPMFPICQKNVQSGDNSGRTADSLLSIRLISCIFSFPELFSSVRLLLEIKARPDFSVCSSHSSWEFGKEEFSNHCSRELLRASVSYSKFSTPIDPKEQKIPTGWLSYKLPIISH